MRTTSYLIVVSLFFAVLFAGCGSDGGGGGVYACSYEKSVTDGCDGYGYGAWTSECVSFNSDDYYISPEQVCANITDGGLFCQAGCCINSKFQNVSLTKGSCP